ncbi:MAG TPA: PHB depolymerase family esterase [Ardenticatenaceae bacterium]
MASKTPGLTRRRLLTLGAASLVAPLVAGCAGEDGKERTTMLKDLQRRLGGASHEEGRLSSWPEQPTEEIAPGQHPLGLDGERDGLLYVPAGYQPDQPAPFALMLHGAGGNAQHGLSLLQGLADEAGLVLLAVDSRRATWDVIALRRYGPDVAFIDAALEHAFARCNVDPERVAVGGFSDGASYALSLGLTNGDLFTHVIAYSPGFMAPAEQVGEPRLFISHGTRDTVLPIERCSRRIVPQVERAGYDVVYHEFDGPHTVPAEIARQSLDWFTAATG